MKLKAALLVLSVLAIGPLALTFAGAQEDDSAEKGAFVRFVEDKISTPDRKIELGAIDGALSSDVRLASITVSDREGAWLRIEGVHLVWSRLALLRGNLDVDSLEAEKIEVVRKPLPAETVDPAAERRLRPAGSAGGGEDRAPRRPQRGFRRSGARRGGPTRGRRVRQSGQRFARRRPCRASEPTASPAN